MAFLRKGIYTICPVITEGLDEGEETGVKPLDAISHVSPRALPAGPIKLDLESQG
jgi:hypothetical protein